jgi:cation diffusion facilitator family transporter
MTASPDQPRRKGGESTSTVLVALGANLLIAVAKGIAAALTGSAAMAAETAHSVADTANQVFLLIALRTSARPPDPEHPLGYGRNRYFWSLLAAVSIFVTGAIYSAFEGVHTLMSESHDLGDLRVSYLVLAVAFVLESISLTKAVRQVRRESNAHHQSFLAFLRSSDDPTVTTVVFEDSAAVLGLVFAAVGIGLHQVTGSALPDAMASLLIAALLAFVAFRLGRANMRLLSGIQADPRLVRALIRWLGIQREVEAVADLLTLLVGTDQVVVCARIDLDNDLTAAQVELAMVRIGRDLRTEFPDVIEVFLEPVPREHPDVQQRVRDRYGEEIAVRLEEEAERASGGKSRTDS